MTAVVAFVTRSIISITECPPGQHRSKASFEPSGDHAGLPSEYQSSVTRIRRTTDPPLISSSKIWGSPAWVPVNAIRVPSGDHAGSPWETPHPPFEIGRGQAPSACISQMRESPPVPRPRENAILDPSGDHAGERSTVCTAVSWRRWPDAPIT